jgi:hypothetical protein
LEFKNFKKKTKAFNFRDKKGEKKPITLVLPYTKNLSKPQNQGFNLKVRKPLVIKQH